jgi:hypothetical protein
MNTRLTSLGHGLANSERIVGQPYLTGLRKGCSSSIPNLTCAKTSEVQLTSCLKSLATRARFQTR